MRYRKVLTMGLLSLGCLALAAQGGEVTLVRTLVDNSIDTYKITSKVDQTLKSAEFSPMALKITSDMTYKLQTNKVDSAKGSATVEATTTVDDIDAGDSILAQAINNDKKPAPIVQDGTIDKYGHMDLKTANGGDPTAAAIMGAAGSMQAGLFVEFPDHPVKVGDSWDVVVPKGTFTGDQDQKIKAKLTGEKKVDGKDVWTVDVSGPLNIKFDSANAPADANSPLAKTHVLVAGTTDIQGTGTVDKATGKTLTMESTGNVKFNIGLGEQGGVTGVTEGTVSTTVKLKS